MKHKINKLELQIGLEYERGGPQACPPRTSPSSHSSVSRQQCVIPAAKESSGWEKTPELKLVRRGCS